MALIQLKNPHSILAALETRPDEVDHVALARSDKEDGDVWGKITRLAREKKVRISGAEESSRGRSQSRPGDGVRTPVSGAAVHERKPVSPEELFSEAKERKNGKGLWLALDSLQDPHNVGAIFRAAAFFGVQGILLTQERSAPMSSAVYDVASGGVEYVPFTLQTNLQRGFEIAKEAGLWILGTSEHSGDDLRSIQSDRPWLLVLGNEEKGMRRLTEENCDVLCRIPAQGPVTSLNVSVAAGISISWLSAKS